MIVPNIQKWMETKRTLEHSGLATKKKKYIGEEKGMRERHARSGMPSFQNFSPHTLQAEGVWRIYKTTSELLSRTQKMLYDLLYKELNKR